MKGTNKGRLCTQKLAEREAILVPRLQETQHYLSPVRTGPLEKESVIFTTVLEECSWQKYIPKHRMKGEEM